MVCVVVFCWKNYVKSAVKCERGDSAADASRQLDDVELQSRPMRFLSIIYKRTVRGVIVCRTRDEQRLARDLSSSTPWNKRVTRQTAATATAATLMNDVVDCCYCCCSRDNRGTRRPTGRRTAVIVDGIGLISASNKHTKFGGVVLALRD